MILEAILGVLGAAVALLLPGFLLADLLFRNESLPARLLVGASLSVFFSILIATALGYNREAAAATGGVTTLNSWIYHLALVAVLGTALAFYRLGIELRVPKPHIRPREAERQHEEREAEDFLAPRRSEDPEFILHRDLETRR